MVAECRSPRCFLEAVRAAAGETENTLVIGLGASLVACVAGVLLGAWVSSRAGLALDTLAIVPLGVPAIILGLSYLRFYNRTWPVDLTALGNTAGLVILGLAVRGWPFVTRVVAGGHRRIAREWHEAGRLAGLGRLARWRWITGPLVAEHVLAGAVVAFVLAVGDVEISQMLCAPGTGTLALRLFSFLHFGPSHVAASLAVLQMLVAVGPVMIYFVLTNRCLQVI
jgi:ABC-type Fe3+ transport system permease subunit